MNSATQPALTLSTAAARALERGAQSLLARQTPEGYWWGELTADATLEADYILLQLWLHPPVDGTWNPPARDRIERAVQAILPRQCEDGGFSVYPGGPGDVSASVKAYFALKLAGVSPADAPMKRLRERILALGGVQAANSYVKINLSLFNLYPREHAPTIPPEIVLMGKTIYEMSSWTRAIVIPLSLVQASGPRPAPAGFRLDEIFVTGKTLRFSGAEDRGASRAFFLLLDRAFKLWERRGPSSIRRKAIATAERWMLERFERSDGLGAIFPAMQYAVMALDALGHGAGDPARLEADSQFDRLLTDEGGRFFFQPCFSPVWDTAIVAHALGEAGLTPVNRFRRCADWLLSKEVRNRGDWSVKRPDTEPSGWYFEFANEFYPDIDDTAMVLLALKHARSDNHALQEAVTGRAVRWLLDMQSENGGWAAFDADNDCEWLNAVPFADHNAMLDPACPDITGRVLEALIEHGVSLEHPAVQRATRFLIQTQERDGSWFGRWGVNYIYGTYLALRGLRAAGVDANDAVILRAGEWLRSIQNAGGGWGESCRGYDENRFEPAPSTASQTAWALLGLIASGDSSSDSVRRGIEYLIETQDPEGKWHEDLATGTGFPRVFYLTYHLYRDSYPVLALATFAGAQAREGAADYARVRS